MTTIVYLDSSDFSDLSADESTLSEQNRRILDALRSSIRNGSTRCLLSGLHLSEAVHATDLPSHKRAAVRRAGLMQQLCSRNHLRLPHEVMRLELEKAMNGATDATLSTEELLSGKSEWFGLPMALDLGPKRQRATAELDKHIAHLPRNERRKLKSEWSLSKQSGRAQWRRLLNEQRQAPSQEFPFNLLNNQFVLDWIVGDRSDDEFRERLIEVLNDTKGLVECVLDLTNERHTIYGLLRDQGDTILSRIEKSLESVLVAASELIETEHIVELTKILRQTIQKIDFRRIVVSQFANTSIEQLDDRAIGRLVEACPSASTFVNMYSAYAHSLLESNLQRWRQGNKSVIVRKRSDFGDMLHATYAPYCDIFRCDAYFASLLKRDVKIRHVVADRNRLRDLR